MRRWTIKLLRHCNIVVIKSSGDRGIKVSGALILSWIRVWAPPGLNRSRTTIHHNRWLLSETNKIEAALHLSSIACTLALTEVYDKVDLPA